MSPISANVANGNGVVLTHGPLILVMSFGELTNMKGAMRCLQAMPYKYTCYSCQAAVTCVLANRLFHVLGKDHVMLHKIIMWLHNST